jgi:hypothetical protein
MEFIYDDGGRAAAGFKGKTGDCGVRAIAIATGQPYQQVYDEINALAKERERVKWGRKAVSHRRSNSRTGVYKRLMDIYLAGIGWRYVGTWDGEMPWRAQRDTARFPAGPIILNKRKHYIACQDGTIRDTYDSTQARNFETGELVPEGCAIYGYWEESEED